MLSPKAKRNITRIIPFGVIWLTFSLIYSLLERGILGNLHVYPATGVPYNFGVTIVVTAATALISGLLAGTLEILHLHKLFAKKSFAVKSIYKIIIYLSITISFLVITTAFYAAAELKTGLLNERVWRNVWAFFSNYAFWSISVYIAAIIGVSLFYTEVSDNLGQGILHNFFTGKYHKPVEEERIFMFLDMKSSTTIAEHIGHVRYFEMLKAYFSDLSDPIIRYSGEVYQYVGDEVIVSWELKKGLHDNNCLQCFFAMKAAIKRQSGKYMEAFGTLPEFKASIHLGAVTAGEIGVVKKDITFSGDVLNTASRIQGLCNAYQVDLLISEPLVEHLSPGTFMVKALGENELRGRGGKIKLFTVLPA